VDVTGCGSCSIKGFHVSRVKYVGSTCKPFTSLERRGLEVISDSVNINIEITVSNWLYGGDKRRKINQSINQ
jgi:hypothetical protein